MVRASNPPTDSVPRSRVKLAGVSEGQLLVDVPDLSGDGRCGERSELTLVPTVGRLCLYVLLGEK